MGRGCSAGRLLCGPRRTLTSLLRPARPSRASAVHLGHLPRLSELATGLLAVPQASKTSGPLHLLFFLLGKPPLALQGYSSGVNGRRAPWAVARAGGSAWAGRGQRERKGRAAVPAPNPAGTMNEGVEPEGASQERAVPLGCVGAGTAEPRGLNLPLAPGVSQRRPATSTPSSRAWPTVTQAGSPCAAHGGHLAWGTGVFAGAGAEGKARARRWSETSCTASLAPWGLGLPRDRPRPQTHGAGPLEGVSRAAPPFVLGPRSPRRAPRSAGMPRAAATPRRRAKPGQRAGDAEPSPGNRTGERRGCGPRAGLCTHFTDREAERRAARRRRGDGAHSWEKGRTAGSGTAPSRTPALELASPTLSAVSAGAPAEPKPGCRRFETRRRRPAAHPPRCAPSPGAAPARCRGSRCGGRGEGASLCGEVLLAGPPPPLHKWGNSLEGERLPAVPGLPGRDELRGPGRGRAGS